MKIIRNMTVAISVASLWILASCGGNDNTPIPINPAPAPAPTTGVTGYGSCGAVGGDFPFRKDGAPYVGNLMSSNYYGGTNANSLSINLFYSNYMGGDQPLQSIVGSGMFYFPDMLTMLSMPQQTGQNYSFCVSSADPTSGSALPGVFAPADSSIALVLRGITQVPLYTYSPFDPYLPGQLPYGGSYNNYGTGVQGTVPTMVEVSIGNYQGCNAWLYQGRIYGCVIVTIGNNPSYSQNRFMYESR